VPTYNTAPGLATPRRETDRRSDGIVARYRACVWARLAQSALYDGDPRRNAAVSSLVDQAVAAMELGS
jgi:hypothetical protein